MKKISLLLIMLGFAISGLLAQISNPKNPFNQPDRNEISKIHRDFFSLNSGGKPSQTQFNEYIKNTINRELRMYIRKYPMINANNYYDYAFDYNDMELMNFANRIAEEIYTYLNDNRVYVKQGNN